MARELWTKISEAVVIERFQAL